MQDSLTHAVDKVARLPAQEQDVLAAILLEEMASEQRWSRSFKNSQGLLESLASEALSEFKTGKTKPLEQL